METFNGIGQINLNFDWKYSPNFKDVYLKNNYPQNDFKSINIPHSNIELPYNNFDEKIFQFTSTYI